MSEEAPPLRRNLTSKCWRSIEKRLLCHVQTQPDNSSRHVCQLKPGEGEDDPETTYAVFLTVIVSSVLLAITLNLLVILIIALNRRLHTLVNYLTSLLCFNNVIWTAFPIVESLNDHVISALNCAIRYYVLHITRSVNFGIIVTITLLRYLIVVRNHSYPAVRNNMLLFTAIAVLPCIVSLMVNKQDDHGSCGTLFAWTQDGWPINRVAKRDKRFKTFIMLLLEYLIGFGILGFCYVNILIKSVTARKRVNNHRKNARRPAAPRSPEPANLANVQTSPPSPRSRPVKTGQNIATSTKLSVPVDPRQIRRRMDPSGEPVGSTSSTSTEQGSSSQSSGTSKLSVIESGRPGEDQSINNPASPGRQQPDRLHPPAGPPMPGVVEFTEVPLETPDTDTDTTPRNAAHSTGSPVATALSPGPGNDGVVISPSTLQTSGSTPAPATAQTASTGQRLLNVPKITLTIPSQVGRVDIVATIALVAFLTTFFISFTPYIALVNYEKDLNAQCVIMPGARLRLFTIIIISGGITAIFNPLACVIFSRDFRQAFQQTCSQIWECLTVSR